MFVFTSSNKNIEKIKEFINYNKIIIIIIIVYNNNNTNQQIKSIITIIILIIVGITIVITNFVTFNIIVITD